MPIYRIMTMDDYEVAYDLWIKCGNGLNDKDSSFIFRRDVVSLVPITASIILFIQSPSVFNFICATSFTVISINLLYSLSILLARNSSSSPRTIASLASPASSSHCIVLVISVAPTIISFRLYFCVKLNIPHLVFYFVILIFC